MGQARRWLCIAYAFPPISRSGTHRTLGFVQYLNEWGWPATVIAGEAQGEPVDTALPARIPAETVVLRVPCIDRVGQWKHRLERFGLHRSNAAVQRRSATGDVTGPASDTSAKSSKSARGSKGLLCRPIDFLTRAMQLPDDKAGWIRPATAAALRSLRLEPHDLIYSTSPCASAHLAAYAVQQSTGLPWVADFRDPWTDNPFRSLGYAPLRWWDARLEHRVLGAADAVICNTPTLRRCLLDRHVRSADDMTTILNGFDAASLDGVAPKRSGSSDEIILTHCGQFYGPRSPIPWFEALRLAVQRLPEARRLRLHLIGDRTFQGRDLAELAVVAGVAEQVVVTGRLPHVDALSYAAGSDAVVLAGSDGEGANLQIPNKLFEYLALRRPLLATLSGDHPAREVLRLARAAALVCRPNDTDALAAAFLRVARRLPFLEPCDFGGVAQFDRRCRAAELMEVFRHVTGEAEAARTLPADGLRATGEMGESFGRRVTDAGEDHATVAGSTAS